MLFHRWRPRVLLLTQCPVVCHGNNANTGPLGERPRAIGKEVHDTLNDKTGWALF